MQQQLGDGVVVRTIALGLVGRPASRGMPVNNTAPSRCRLVRPLGRIMDVLGRPIDDAGPIGDRERRRSKGGRAWTNCPTTELLGNRHQGDRPVCPFAKGGKVSLFGGTGVGKTVNMMELINNIAKRTAVVRVRRRR